MHTSFIYSSLGGNADVSRLIRKIEHGMTASIYDINGAFRSSQYVNINLAYNMITVGTVSYEDKRIWLIPEGANILISGYNSRDGYSFSICIYLKD